jgi:hypothetical protein
MSPSPAYPAQGAIQGRQDTAQGISAGRQDTAQGRQNTAQGAVQGRQDTAQGLSSGRQDIAQGRQDAAQSGMQGRQGTAQGISDNRRDTANDLMNHREDMVDAIGDIYDDVRAPGWSWAVGAAVVALPPVYHPVVYQNTTYYYSDGHYLEPVYCGDDVTYMVTLPAIGTIYCGGLPSDAQVLYVNGNPVYVYEDVCYAPYPESGPDCYIVVNAP